MWYFRFLLIIFLFWPLVSHPQANSINDLPFQSGEKIYYKAVYNWHFLWIEAGKIEFSVDLTTYDHHPALHFNSFGRTLPAYDWFFKVRDHFESVANAITFQPYWFIRNTSEGNYKAYEKYNFDYSGKRIISQVETSNKPLTKTILPLQHGLMDVQTAVYYARTLNFKDMKPGEKIYFKMIIDGAFYDIYGRYHGVEVIENYDGQRYRCHKFSALLVEGTIFSGGEDLLVWVTDDGNKIPVIVEAKILVGSVKAYYIKGENLKFPIETISE